MTQHQWALRHAENGLPVFPIAAGKKSPPLIQDFQGQATTDPAKIKAWWTQWPDANIGISTKDLVVVDVDNGPGKSGDESLLALELRGQLLNPTYMQQTPNGFHYVYSAPYPVKQGTSVLGKHLDIRAYGGYIVGAGSVIGAKSYGANELPLSPCPQWVLDTCGPAATDKKKIEINEDHASSRAISKLKSLKPAEGGKRNDSAFKAASLVKDEGVSQALCLYLMLEHFKCDPPLDRDELTHVVQSAYKYGNSPVGSTAPEVVFAPTDADPPAIASTPEKHPFDVLNEEFAFVLAGGGFHILWETKDFEGKCYIEHLSPLAFHEKFSSWTMQIGDKTHAVTRLWMKSKRRRSYDGLCFAPGGNEPKNFYNLWRGFSVEPLSPFEEPTPEMTEALDMFLSHARENVCANDEALFNWLMGYFAHLVQSPGEKPLTALVFRGEKGVGKNTLIEIIGVLLGPHFKVAADRRYLLGNFNAHLERALLFVLDEAFWSGDKQSEGVLKSIITSRSTLIERKGQEAYEVKNCMRVVIIGNDDWLVPATADERRFAVFDVGTKRKQDTHFFHRMRKLMEGSGGRYLLRYLMDYKITTDVNVAPKTQGLLDQKLESLSPFHQWWFESLKSAHVVDCELQEWPAQLEKSRLREAFRRYCKGRNISSRIISDVSIGKVLSRISPGVKDTRPRKDGARIHHYEMPALDQCRQDWEAHVGHPIQWD